jgi:hypothetical protein
MREDVFKDVFCPNCKLGGQRANWPCKRCKQWVKDPGSAQGEEVRKTRTLKVAAAGLFLAAGAFIMFFVGTGGSRGRLAVAALCYVVAAIFALTSRTP